MITFENGTSDKRKITVETSDNDKLGVFYLSIMGKFTENTTKKRFSNFTLTIKDECYRSVITAN